MNKKKSMKKIRAANTPDKSNKILLRARKTAAIKVIKHYCLRSFTPGSQKLLECSSTGDSLKHKQSHSLKHKQRDSLKHITNAQARRLPAHAA